MQGLDLLLIEAIRPAHQHQVGGAQLIVKQGVDVAEVIQAGISHALGLEGRRIGNNAAVAEGFPINHGHHTGDTGSGTDLRPAEGLDQRKRQRQATGLDNNSIQFIGPLEQLLHHRKELVLHGAAETAIGEFHDAAVELLFRAKAAAADQITIDADFAELVDENGKTQATGEKQLTQQGGFTGAKESGHHRDRKTCGRSLVHAQATRAVQVKAAPMPTSTQARAIFVTGWRSSARRRSATREAVNTRAWLSSKPKK